MAGWRDLPRRGRGLNLSTLIVLRWLAILGQSSAILTAYFWLGFRLPLAPCLLVILVSVAMNIGAMRSLRIGEDRADGFEPALQLGFDIVQLACLLGLTGGLENPFCLLLVAPVTIAAAALPTRQAMGLAALALLATLMLFHWSLPLPWRLSEGLEFPPLYRLGMGLALSVGLTFTAGYAWRVAVDAEKLELALATTQDVLQREQRMAALGGLAAAAAHELGTPLATIQIVARELLRASPPDSGAAEDATLILQQAERCRGILQTLSQRPENGDTAFAEVEIKTLLEEVVAPHRGFDLDIGCEVATADGQRPPRVRRLPEVLHGLSTLVENAADFAQSRVRVQAWVDADWIVVDVLDDGPGIASEILPRLGQPYVTSRPQTKARRALVDQLAAAAQMASAARPQFPGRRRHGPEPAPVAKPPAVDPNIEPSQGGMGLGFFIANNLLERTGGRLNVGSAETARLSRQAGQVGPQEPMAGARVTVRWPRHALEATP